MSLGKVYGVRLPLATAEALEDQARDNGTTVAAILRTLAITHHHCLIPVNKTGAENWRQAAVPGAPVSVTEISPGNRPTRQRRAAQ